MIVFIDELRDPLVWYKQMEPLNPLCEQVIHRWPLQSSCIIQLLVALAFSGRKQMKAINVKQVMGLTIG